MKILALIAWLTVQLAASLQPDRGTVTGQIRSTNGGSAAGVRITAMVVPQPGVVATDAATFERLTTTDSNGRFRLEDMRPGRYYVAAGLVEAPTYFPGVSSIASARVVVVTAGSTVSGIDFTLAQSPGVKVTGRIKGVPDNLPAGFIRATLAPRAPTQPGGQPIEALVSPDGTFEFQKVPPGTYNVRTNPPLAIPLPIIPVDVKDSDLGPIELTIGAVIVGQVTVEDGSRLPLPMALTSGALNNAGNNGNVNIPSLVQLGANRIASPPSATPFGPMVRADGAVVVVNFQPGEYRITARLPFGYRIKSMTFGDIDLLRTTLKIDDAAHANGTLRVVLTTTPGTVAGVKVSGHLTGAPTPANSWISMQASSSGLVTEGGIGDALLRPDGTFEFQRVPPGVYSARILPLRGNAPQIAVVVSDVDVTGVEVPNTLAAASAGSPPPALGTPTFPGQPAPLAIQPPSYPPGVTVTGRVSMEKAANGDAPRAVVLFGPRDGLSVQAPIRSDGTFEIQNVSAGTYDARTLPLLMPAVSTRVVVGDKNLSGIALNLPGSRTNP